MAVWSETSARTVIESNRIDSEFYHPEYTRAEEKIRRIPHKNLGELVKFVPGPFGSAFHVQNYSHESIYRYIRGQDVKPFSIKDDEKVFIPDNDYRRLEKYSLFEEDILISVVGTLGNSAIITENNIPSIFSCKSTALRNASINPYLLVAFLNSKLGKLCVLRRQRGAIQTGLNIEDLCTVPVPIINDTESSKIAFLVKNGLKKSHQAKSLYSEAKQLLESELGLDKIVFEKPMGYEASYSEVLSNNRADADYYQVPFRQIEKKLSNLTVKPLAKIASLTKGIEVGSKYYTSSGKLFIRVSNVKENGIETGNCDKYISSELFNTLQSYLPRVGELLLTKDGTPGVCYVVDEPLEGVISSGIVKMKMLDQDLSPEYLALVINSKICRMQIERACSGALIVHWKPVEISRLKIPIASSKLRQEISGLVQKSKSAKRESENLLKEAKKRVEDLIEEATNHEPVS